MLNFMLGIFSSMLNMNLKDPHDVPFALPMLFFIFLSFIITMTVLHFIGNDNSEVSEQD